MRFFVILILTHSTDCRIIITNFSITTLLYGGFVVAAKGELTESCTADGQCRDVNAICLNAVCTCRPGYTAQQATCGTITLLLLLLLVSSS